MLKTLTAANKRNEAQQIAERASQRGLRARADLQRSAEAATAKLSRYGRTRLESYDIELRMLGLALGQLGHFTAAEDEGVLLDLQAEMHNLGLHDIDFDAIDQLKAGAVAAGAGAGAGAVSYFATIGAVGAFASTSAGVPLAGLSGAALANATLAWLGGGALAAGGAGVAGGTAVLGAVAAAPAALVGIGALHLQAGHKIKKAKAYALEIAIAMNKMRLQREATDLIGARAESFDHFAQQLRGLMYAGVRHAVELARNGHTVETLSDEDLKQLHLTFEMARLLKALLDTPLMTDDYQPHPDAGPAEAAVASFLGQDR